MTNKTFLFVILIIGIVLLLCTSCNEDGNQPTDPNLFVAPTVSRTVTQIALVDKKTGISYKMGKSR